MRLVKKNVLKEDYNTSDKTEDAVVISDSDAKYKQAILTAIGSKSGAWNEYNTILSMEQDVSPELVSRFHDTITDIRNEEMKHIGQLTTKASELPDMKDAYEAGKTEAEEGNEESLNLDSENNKETKEAVTESVEEKIPDNTRRFSSDSISDIIYTSVDPNDLTKDIFNDDMELTAEEVDERLIKVQKILDLTPIQMEELEQKIIASKDPVVARANEIKIDRDNDIGLIRTLLEDIRTPEIRMALENLLDELNTSE